MKRTNLSARGWTGPLQKTTPKAKRVSRQQYCTLAWLLDAYHHKSALVTLGLNAKKLDREIERARLPFKRGRPPSLNTRDKYKLIVRIADRHLAENPGSNDTDASRVLVCRMRDSCNWLKKPVAITLEVNYTKKYLSRARKALSR